MRYALAIGALFAAIHIGTIASDALEPNRPMPRLIAHDCDGAGGDLWAMEESDFPTQCRNIERY